MSKKIFSGDDSKKFWRTLRKAQIDILFDYGCKAQEIESQRDDLLEALEEALKESHNPKVEKILEAAIAKATPKP